MRLSTQAAFAAAIVSLAFISTAAANDATAPAAAVHKGADCATAKDAKGEPKPDCDVRNAAREPQTHKMVRCNEEAGKKQLHGDERRAFMSACLKG